MPNKYKPFSGAKKHTYCSKVTSLSDALKKCGLKDGMCLSFHHQLRNGDFVINKTLEAVRELNIKNIMMAQTAMFNVHEPVIDFIKEGVVLIDFFAEWCMPCLMMAPVIDELSEKFKGKIKFGKVDVADNEEIAQRFNVSSIPNLTLLKDGKVIEQFVGSISSEELDGKLKEFI